MKINKRVTFCAAHSIAGAGKCANKHGHNWEANIEVEIDDTNMLDSRGFVIDIAELKQAAFKYDHDDLDKYFESASTENVAQKIAEDALEICEKSNSKGKFYVYVSLQETENNSANAIAWSV